MDLKTIKTFKTIVRLGSFQRAAEELNYAQSTVTMHIKNLESELGVLLLKRGKRLQLTEAGHLLNEKGDYLLKGFDHLQNSLDDLVQGESGHIRIGMIEPVASYRMPSLLAAFSERFPKVKLSLYRQPSHVLFEMIEEDQIDFALCTSPEMGDRTRFEPIYSEKAVLLIPMHHPLQKVEQLALTHLQNVKMVTTASYCPFRRLVEKQLVEIGITPTYGMEINDLLLLKQYVQFHTGVAIVPQIAVTPPPANTVQKEILSLQSEIKVGILRREDKVQEGKALRYLLGQIRKSFKSVELVSC